MSYTWFLETLRPQEDEDALIAWCNPKNKLHKISTTTIVKGFFFFFKTGCCRWSCAKQKHSCTIYKGMAEVLLTWLHIDRWLCYGDSRLPSLYIYSTKTHWKNSLRWMIEWTRKACTLKVTKRKKKKVQNERWVQKYGSENQEQPLCLLYKLVSFLIIFYKNVAYNTILFFWIWIIIYS